MPPDLDKLSRTPKRLTKLLSKGSANTPVDSQKSWSLDSLLSPTSFDPLKTEPDQLGSIEFIKNQLVGPDIFSPSAKISHTDSGITMPTTLAFRSIGYKSEPMDGMKDVGINFDGRRGIIPNDYQGRVTRDSPEGSRIPGMYCSGWVKRGPAGVIANTMEDAFSTAEAIVRDWETKQPFMADGQGWNSLKEEAKQRRLRTVSWADWRKIDVAERERGKAKGKEREKFASVREMLQVLD